jgi:hypothetical protein
MLYALPYAQLSGHVLHDGRFRGAATPSSARPRRSRSRSHLTRGLFLPRATRLSGSS